MEFEIRYGSRKMKSAEYYRPYSEIIENDPGEGDQSFWRISFFKCILPKNPKYEMDTFDIQNWWQIFKIEKIP